MGEGVAGGGSLSLAALLDEHGGAVAAAWEANYHSRFADALSTRGPVEILALLRWLPDTSPMHAAIQGGLEFYGWGRDRHLAADAVDVAIATAMGKKFKADQHGVKRPQMKATQGSAKSITAFMPPTLRRRLNDGG